MEKKNLIHLDDKPKLLRALLLRHRHVNESGSHGFPFGARRKFSSYTSLQVILVFCIRIIAMKTPHQHSIRYFTIHLFVNTFKGCALEN